MGLWAGAPKERGEAQTLLFFGKKNCPYVVLGAMPVTLIAEESYGA